MAGNFRSRDEESMTDIVGGGMSDKPPLPHIGLRDRIAAVIQENLVWEAPNLSARLADAVIKALNLRTDQVGTLTRYVTEWIDHD